MIGRLRDDPLFETSFTTVKLAVLIGFVPVIMGMAGNIGSQTSTIAVRGLATGRLSHEQGRIHHFLWQQMKVGSLLGLTCSSLVAVAAWVFGQSPYLALAVGLSLFITVLVASFTGALIPVVFDRMAFDPAVVSGPLVTTANDVFGILIYFGLSTFFFRFAG